MSSGTWVHSACFGPARLVTPLRRDAGRETKSLHLRKMSSYNPAQSMRCGPKCQTTHPQSFEDPDVYRTPPRYYPNLPADPTNCSRLPNEWRRLSTPESLENITTPVGPLGKVRTICNRSCPQADVACGLQDVFPVGVDAHGREVLENIGMGVMDSVTSAGLGSGNFARERAELRAQELGEFGTTWEGYDPLEHPGVTGAYCCGKDKKGKPKILGRMIDTMSVGRCTALGGNPVMTTAACFQNG